MLLVLFFSVQESHVDLDSRVIETENRGVTLKDFKTRRGFNLKSRRSGVLKFGAKQGGLLFCRSLLDHGVNDS